MPGVTDISCLTDTGDGFACMMSAVTAAFGTEAVLGFVIGGMLMLVLYVGSSYHPAPPTIGAFLIGGILVPALPPQYQGFAQTIMLLGFVTGSFVLLRRYFLQVGR